MMTDDLARQCPPLNMAPGAECADSGRMFQGIPSVERAWNGRLWAAWYGGGVTEGRHNYVMLATSGNDGTTWSGLKLVIDPDGDGPCRAFDPCLWLDPGGRLWLFWAQRHRSTQLWSIRTRNPGAEAPQWTRPRRIAEGILMNKPLALSSGHWLLPVAQWHRDGSCGVVASTDAGNSFRLRGRANIPNPADRDCDEHMLVQRRDGSLWMLARTRYGVGESVSTDGGATWTPIVPSKIRHATARFFIRRLRSGSLLLVKHGPIATRTGRSHLTACLSRDDGRTWTGGLLLDGRRGVSYPDGVQAPDGTVYIIYDYSRQAAKQILLAVFSEDAVAAGHCVRRVRVEARPWACKSGAVGDAISRPAGPSRLRVLVNRATGLNPQRRR